MIFLANSFANQSGSTLSQPSEQSAQQGLADAGHTDKPLNTFGDRERPQKKQFTGFKV